MASYVWHLLSRVRFLTVSPSVAIRHGRSQNERFGPARNLCVETGLGSQHASLEMPSTTMLLRRGSALHLLSNENKRSTLAPFCVLSLHRLPQRHRVWSLDSALAGCPKATAKTTAKALPDCFCSCPTFTVHLRDSQLLDLTATARPEGRLAGGLGPPRHDMRLTALAAASAPSLGRRNGNPPFG